MFGIVSSLALREQAVALADDFVRSLAAPPRKGAKGGMEADAARAMHSLFEAAGSFCAERRLTIIGRARLAKALQDELHSRGYSAELASKITSAVTINALASPANAAKAEKPPPQR